MLINQLRSPIIVIAILLTSFTGCKKSSTVITNPASNSTCKLHWTRSFLHYNTRGYPTEFTETIDYLVSPRGIMIWYINDREITNSLFHFLDLNR